MSNASDRKKITRKVKLGVLFGILGSETLARSNPKSSKFFENRTTCRKKKNIYCREHIVRNAYELINLKDFFRTKWWRPWFHPIIIARSPDQVKIIYLRTAGQSSLPRTIFVSCDQVLYLVYKFCIFKDLWCISTSDTEGNTKINLYGTI